MKLYTVWLFLPMQQLQSKFNCIWGHTLEFMENWFLYVALLIAAIHYCELYIMNYWFLLPVVKIIAWFADYQQIIIV